MDDVLENYAISTQPARNEAIGLVQDKVRKNVDTDGKHTVPTSCGHFSHPRRMQFTAHAIWELGSNQNEQSDECGDLHIRNCVQTGGRWSYKLGHFTVLQCTLTGGMMSLKPPLSSITD